jgi:ergothioneine biosynthesis protein EgtB
MRRPVTNGDVLSFIEDGGYGRAELWLDMGWSRVEAEGWDSPLYWERADDGGWTEYTHAGREALDADRVAGYLSFFEADAIARWSGARLPTEAEWEHAWASGCGGGVALLDGRVFVEGSGLRAGVSGVDGNGVAGLMGGVWEWTRSSHEPYPGYAPPAGAVGEYNGKFMCNQYVLRGGSCLTSVEHVRGTYRNFFEPEARWQCAGVRLARSL